MTHLPSSVRGRIVGLTWALSLAAVLAAADATAHTIGDLAPYHLAPEDHFVIPLGGITLAGSETVVVRFTHVGSAATIDESAESFTASEVGVRVPATAAVGQHDVAVLVNGTPNTGDSGHIWVRTLPFELVRQASGNLPGQADANVVDFKDSDFADVDNDGFLDILEAVSVDGGAGNDDRLYINQLGKTTRDCAGTSFFCNQTASQYEQSPAGLDPNERTYDADLVDIDLDGDLDLVRGDAKDNVPLRLLVNDGAGHFDDQTLALLPALATVGGVTHWACEVDSGDADGDGRLDLLLCSWGAGNEQNALLLNRLQTTGKFVLANDSPCDPAAPGAHALCKTSSKNNRGCAFGFFNGDDNLDIIMPSIDDQGDVVLLYNGESGGIPQYEVREDWVHGAGGGASIAGQNGDLKVADLDGDGDDDVAISEPQAGDAARRRILWNDNGTRLVDLDVSRYPESGNDYDVSFGDLDRDGDVDLVFGNRYSAFGPVLINKGGRDERMRFDPPTSSPFWLTQSPGGVIAAGANVDFGLSVSPGDFDLDGDLDLLTGGFYRMGLWMSNLFQKPGQARDWIFILDKTRSMVKPARDFFEPAKNVLASFSVQRRDDDAVGFVTFDYTGPDPGNNNAPDNANKAQRVVEVGDQGFFALADTIRATALGTCSGFCTSIGWGLQTGMDSAADAPVPDPNLPREQVLVLATDGEQNQGPHPDTVIPNLPAHARLYTVALGSETDDRMLSALATNGGKFYFAGRSDDYTSVQSDLREIDEDIEGDATGKQPLLPIANLGWAKGLLATLHESPVVSRAVAAQPLLLETPLARALVADGRERYLFLLDPADREVRFTLSWRNSDREVEMVVTDPRGQVVDPATNDKGRLRRWTRTLAMTVYDPLSGVWIVERRGGGDLGPVKATGIATSGLTVVGEAEHPRFYLGEHLILLASPRDGLAPITAARGAARCTSPSEAVTVVSAQTDPTGALRFDCGPASEAGSWNVEVTVFGPPSRPFVRFWREALHVAAPTEEEPDLRTAELALDRAELTAGGTDRAIATLRLRRRDGAPLVGGAVRFLVRGGEGVGPVSDNGDGTYTRSIAAGPLVGTGVVMAGVGLERLPNRAEFAIRPADFDPAHANFEIMVGPKLLCTNQKGTFGARVHAMDAFDNPLTGATVDIRQTQGHALNWTGQVAELAPGVYERRFGVPRQPTQLGFAATVNGVAAASEPRLDVFAPDSAEGRLAFCSDAPVPDGLAGCLPWIVIVVLLLLLLALWIWWLRRRGVGP